VLGLLSRKFALSLTTAVLETNLAQFLDVRLGVTGPLLGLVFSYLGTCHRPYSSSMVIEYDSNELIRVDAQTLCICVAEHPRDQKLRRIMVWLHGLTCLSCVRPFQVS
jgi:hypothetical protein